MLKGFATALFIFGTSTYSQNQSKDFVLWDDYRIDSELSNELFFESDSIYNPLTLVYLDSLGGMHFDNVNDSSKYLLSANCQVKDDLSTDLFFRSVRVIDSLIEIFICGYSPAESNSIWILISGNQFTVEYAYDTPYPANREFEVQKQKLVFLEEPENQSGTSINGYIKLKVRMIEDEKEIIVEIEGYFKCRIPL